MAAAGAGRHRSRDLSPSEDTMDSPSSSPDTRGRRAGRRRSLASPVGPPLLDGEETSAARRGGKTAPVLSLSKRPSLSWIIGGWVMDLSMYTPADAPPPVHIENRSHWPRALLDYDPAVMDDATLARRGDDIVDLVRAECAIRGQRLTDKPPDDIVRKTFDGVRCLYVVHASMDIPSSFDDVVSILTHRSFFGHVFGHQLLAASELRRVATAASPPCSTTVQRLHLHVPRGYKRQQAMHVTFLDYARGSGESTPSTPGSWTRVFKSIDRQAGGPGATAPVCTTASTSSTSMTHVVGGLHVEVVSASRTRLSFYGDSCVPSVLAVKMDGTHAFLDAFGQSVALVHRMLRRRRSHRHHLHHLDLQARSAPPFDDVEWGGVVFRPLGLLATPSAAPSPVVELAGGPLSGTPVPVDTSRCRLCAERFHFFRAVHSCATCLASFCAGCLRRHAPLCHPPSPVSSSSSSSPASSPEATPSLVANPTRNPAPTQPPGECDQETGHPPTTTTTSFPWLWRRCVTTEPLRQSLSANHFSALLQDDDDDVDTIRLLRRQHRAASFD